MDQNKQLEDYIKQELEKGTDKITIKENLVKVGWSSDQIEPVINKLSPEIQTSNMPAIQNNDQISASEAMSTVISQDDHVVVNTNSEETVKQGSSRLPKIGIIVLIFLLIAGVGAAIYGYFFYYLAPDRIVAKSVEKMQEVQTYDYSGSLIFKINGDLYSAEEIGSEYEALSLLTPREFSTSFFGSMDANDETNIKSESTINLEMNSVEFAEVQMLALGEVFYIKLNNLNTFGLFPVDDYLNKWLFVNMSELSEEYDLDYQEQESNELSQEHEVQITNSFTTHKPFEIIEELDNETRNDKEVYHYKYTIHKDKLKLFLQDVSDVLKSYPQSEDVDVEDLHQIMDGIEFYDGDIWIGVDEYYLYGFTGGLSTEIPDSEAELEVAVNMDFDRFNEPKNIVAPTDYMTFEEFNQMLLMDFSEVYPSSESSMLEEDVNGNDLNELLQTLQFQQPDVSGMTDER